MKMEVLLSIAILMPSIRAAEVPKSPYIAFVYRYGDATEPGQISEMLIGTINRAAAGDPFAGIADGQILYGDPLSARWRAYHGAQMREWNRVTGTDANYEDTAGCAGDFGNGEVDGLAGQHVLIRVVELVAGDALRARLVAAVERQFVPVKRLQQREQVGRFL